MPVLTVLLSLVLFALGAPHQELWGERALDALDPHFTQTVKLAGWGQRMIPASRTCYD